MQETLHQPPTYLPPAECAASPQGRRFRLVAAGLAFLVLSAVGFGLLSLMAIPDGHLAGPKDEGTRPTSGDLPRDQVASSPSGPLTEILAEPDIVATHRHPLLGRPAPDFELADPDGNVWRLKELLDGRPVVVVFYYGYHCTSCVRQLFSVDRDLPLFGEVGARVVAISADPPELTRRGFQQNGPFGFPALSDPGDKVAAAYHLFKRTQDGKLAESRRHGTFLIDREGIVQWINFGDAPLRRNPALLYQLAKMEGHLPSVRSGR